jgi:two-component system cell cycle response regulator
MAGSYDSQRRRILVVEDEPKVRTVVTFHLRSLGYGPDAASTALHARALVATQPYDLVLADLMLPGPDGSQLIEDIARASPHTIFIVMTGLTDLSSHLPARLGQRIIGVLKKPFDKPTLAEAVARAFDLIETRQQLADERESPVSLLLVEDDRAHAQLVKRALAKLGGFDCFQVSRLAEAIESAHNCKFDTIITDLALPDARGLDAVVKLRQLAPEAALIVSSGSDDEAVTLKALELGAQDFIVKGSFDVGGLGRAIRFARVRREGQLRLARLAHSDGLTGLWNRAALSSRLEEALAQAKRHASVLGLIYIDLDGFKAVNDGHGHDAGDHLLLQISTRLKAAAREYDTVARLGGDEFALLVTHLELDALMQTAERLLAAVAAPVSYRNHELRVTASIGLAFYPVHGSDATLLLKLADEAMYESKRAGKGQIRAAVRSDALESASISGLEPRPSHAHKLY